LLALAPLALFLSRRSALSPGIVMVLASVLLFCVVWAWGLLQNLRYLLPAIPMITTLLVVGLFRALRAFPFPIVSFAVLAALSLSICANAFGPQAFWGKAISGTALPYKVTAGIETKDQYLTTYLPGYRALQFANRLSDNHVQIWAPHYWGRLYSRWPIFFEDIHATEPYATELPKSMLSTANASEINESLRSLGFTHILVSAAQPEVSLPERQRPMYLRTEFLDQFTRLEFAWSNDVLYRLVEPAALRNAPVRVNRILTADFESVAHSVPSEWVTIGDITFDIDGSHALAGQRAVGTHGSSLVIYPYIPIHPDGLYQLRFFAQSDEDKTTSTAWVRFLAEDMTTEPISSAPLYYYPNREYTASEVYATAPEGARFAQIFLGGLQADHITWISDLSFSEILPD
jgi:hypothetical protein